MALVDRTHAPAAASLAEVAAAAARRFALWREYRRTLAELRALDDRTLADLGYTRAGLRGLAREAVGL
jgi:uncharacterized protein YjiS (DUF1127 family)